jgi:signal transduction histidine kinase
MVMFFAVVQSFLFYSFIKIFPQEKIKSFSIKIILPVSLFLIAGIATLTNTVFRDIKNIDAPGVPTPIIGNGIFIFAIPVLYFVLSGLYIMINRYIKTQGPEKLQLKYLLIGTGLMFGLMISLIFLPVIIFNYTFFVNFSSLFVTTFVIFSTISILKYKLFNIKVIATQLFVFLLWIFLFIRLLISNNTQDIIVNAILLISTFVIGIFLMNSVSKEVKQREEIETLAGNLALTNNQLKFANDKLKELDRQKTEFVSIASHQLRSPLTAIKGYSSMLLEGSFGPIEDKARGAIDRIFDSSQKLVNVIEDFLNITRIELGRMKYEVSVFDLSKLAETVMTDQRPNVEKKGLAISLEATPGDYQISADSGKVTQVISNVIDNSIKYTPARTGGQGGPTGWIKIKLENMKRGKGSKGKEVVRLTIADSGVGLEPATLKKLFNKFVRATDAGKTNITGTGLGLYVAKQIVEGLGGKIWAESEGKGKGSQFIVEFPHSDGKATTTKTKVEAYTKADLKKTKGK